MDAMEGQLAGMTLHYDDEGESSSSSSSSRPWAEMAPDALAHIFRRLPLHQLLTIIPCVCKPWKLASLNPLCYQTLELQFNPYDFDEHLIKVLLARSQGCLLEIFLPDIGSLPLLYLIVRSVPLLQKLHIPYSHVYDEWATFAAPLMPHLVDVDISMCDRLSHEAIEAFGKNCKHIRLLRKNRRYCSGGDGNDCISFDDSDAVAIAQYYPCLEHLELQDNPLSKKGLQAILDNCPLLEYLNLRGCKHLEHVMDSSLFDKCQAQVKVFNFDFGGE